MSHHDSKELNAEVFADAMPCPATTAICEALAQFFTVNQIDTNHAGAALGRMLGGLLVKANVSEADYKEIMDAIWVEGMEAKAYHEGRSIHATNQPEEIRVSPENRKTV